MKIEQLVICGRMESRFIEINRVMGIEPWGEYHRVHLLCGEKIVVSDDSARRITNARRRQMISRPFYGWLWAALAALDSPSLRLLASSSPLIIAVD